MAASRTTATLHGAKSGASLGRLLGIGAIGTLLGLVAALYLAVTVTVPTIGEIHE